MNVINTATDVNVFSECKSVYEFCRLSIRIRRRVNE